jgi:glycosyltransferase involved in cell wall biosynthesis
LHPLTASREVRIMHSPQSRILLIAGTSLWQSSNHRIQHLAAHLKLWGRPFDVVGRVNFYTGPPADSWTRFSQGARSLVQEPARVVRTGEDLQIAVRGLPRNFLNSVGEAWAYFIVRRLIRKRYELCIYGHPNNALLALFLKKRGIVGTLIYDDWDYFPGDVTSVKGRLDTVAMKWREMICIRNAEVVLSVSHPLAELRKRQGAREVLVVPNGVDYSLFRAAQNKMRHPPTLIYMGSLYSAWGADLPIRALPAIRAKIPNIRYVVLGAGPDEDALRSLAYEKMNLRDCVLFLGRQEPHELPHFLAEADIGVLTCRQVPFREYASPLKAYEYMAAGLPVVGTRVGEAAKVIETSQSGVIVDSTPEAFAEAVIGLLADSRRYEMYSANAIGCAVTYDWEQVLAPLQDLLHGLLAPGIRAAGAGGGRPA